MTYSITFPLRRQGCLTATRFLNSSGSVTVLGATTSKWYTRYSWLMNIKRTEPALDFDDLIMVLAQRMEDRPELREMIAGLFDLIMVMSSRTQTLRSTRCSFIWQTPLFRHEQRHYCRWPRSIHLRFRAAEYYNIKRFIDDYNPEVVFLIWITEAIEPLWIQLPL